MSKYSLQQEEKDSFLAHQREVDERRILDATHTLASSPLLRQPQQPQQPQPSQYRHHHQAATENTETHTGVPIAAAPRASTVPVAASTVPESDYLSADQSTAQAAPRLQSAYLREVLQPTHLPSARTSTESDTNPPLSSQSHLKAELSQLDVEIGEIVGSFLIVLYRYKYS